MNTYRIKKVDVITQAILILAGFIFAILMWDFESLITVYFIIGGLQVISVLINLKLKCKKARSRKSYQLVLLFLPLGLIPPLTLGFLMILIFLAPVLAIWYLIISLRES